MNLVFRPRRLHKSFLAREGIDCASFDERRTNSKGTRVSLSGRRRVGKKSVKVKRGKGWLPRVRRVDRDAKCDPFPPGWMEWTVEWVRVPLELGGSSLPSSYDDQRTTSSRSVGHCRICSGPAGYVGDQRIGRSGGNGRRQGCELGRGWFCCQSCWKQHEKPGAVVKWTWKGE